MDKIVVVEGEVSLSKVIQGEINLSRIIDGEGEKVVQFSDFLEYTGETEITPGAEDQVLATENRLVRDNIVVKAIPDNYGLITWNGSYLTVS